jgi:hypothetical protein
MPNKSRINRQFMAGCVGFVLFLGLTAGIAAAARGFTGHSAARSIHAANLAHVSQHSSGPPIPLTGADREAIARLSADGYNIGAVQSFASRGGHSFVQLTTPPGAGCFAVSNSSDALDQTLCQRGFPSAGYPLVDFTITKGGLTTGSGGGSVVASYGIAADGVASVGFETAGGDIVGVTPVVENVYANTGLPSQLVTKLVALDALGNVVWSKDVAQA